MARQETLQLPLRLLVMAIHAHITYAEIVMKRLRYGLVSNMPTHAGYDPELKNYYLTTSPETRLIAVAQLLKSGYKIQMRTGIKSVALLTKRR